MRMLPEVPRVPQRKFPLSPLYVLVIIAAVGAFALWYAGKDALTPAASTTSSPTDTSLLTREGSAFWMHADIANFTFKMPFGWMEVATTSVPAPEGALENLAAFRKASAGCLLSYTRMPAIRNINESAYRQTSVAYPAEGAPYADDVDGQQINPIWWWAPVRYLPPDFNLTVPEFHVRKPFPHEVQIAEYPEFAFRSSTTTYGAFFLSDAGGGTLNESCASDLIALLESAAEKFQATTIDASSAGKLFMIMKYGTEGILFFVPANGIPYEVSRFPMRNNAYSIVAHGNALFFAEAGDIRSIDPFSGTLYQVTLSADKTVNAFYFYEDRLFYLAGNADCNEYRGACSNELFEYDPVQKVSVSLAKELSSRYFMGYDAAENALYVAYGDGDAGCSSGSVERYDFRAARVEKVLKYGACAGEPDPPEMQAFTSLQKQFDEQNIFTGYLALLGGVFQTPVTNYEYANAGVVQFQYEPGEGPALEWVPVD